MRLWIANMLKQDLIFYYRLPESGRLYQQNIGMGQQIQVGGNNLSSKDVEAITDHATIYGACKADQIDRAKGMISMMWSEEHPVPLDKLKTVFERNHNHQVIIGKQLRKEMAIKADEAILAPPGVDPNPAAPFTRGLEMTIEEEDKKVDVMTEVNDVITVKRNMPQGRAKRR